MKYQVTRPVRWDLNGETHTYPVRETKMNVGQFSEEWESLKKDHDGSQFDYGDPSVPIRSVIKSHFESTQLPTEYGVYVVRQMDEGEVLYIGKGGTVNNLGQFKKQNLRGRLANVKSGVSANHWFWSLVREKGSIVIEYVALDKTPLSPGLVEAALLQAFLNEHGRLPYRNKAL